SEVEDSEAFCYRHILANHDVQGFEIAMYDILPMSCSHSGRSRANEIEGSCGGHGAFLSHDFLQRAAVDKFHYQEWHRSTHHSKVRHRNYVGMFDCSGSQRFLPKASYQHRIVADQVRQNDFDRVLSF